MEYFDDSEAAGQSKAIQKALKELDDCLHMEDKSKRTVLAIVALAAYKWGIDKDTEEEPAGIV